MGRCLLEKPGVRETAPGAGDLGVDLLQVPGELRALGLAHLRGLDLEREVHASGAVPDRPGRSVTGGHLGDTGNGAQQGCLFDDEGDEVPVAVLHEDRHLRGPGEVPLASQTADRLDHGDHGVHAPLDLVRNQVVVAQRVSLKRDALRFPGAGSRGARQALPELLGQVRHHRMQQPQARLEREQNGLGGPRPRRLSRQGRLRELDVPVAELVPEEVVERVAGPVEAKLLEGLVDRGRGVRQAGEDPTFGSRQVLAE